MERFAMNKIRQWKQNNYRKPLMIVGARRVGKTWIMKEFGENEYRDYVYIDFASNNREINNLFTLHCNARQLLIGLETYAKKEIAPGNTLIIFDEIQKMPQFLSKLQCIYEDTRDYHIICAGSQSVTALYANDPFFVKHVEVLTLYPMSFQEFFEEVEREANYKKFVYNSDYTMMSVFKERYIEALKIYFFVGGMPEAVLDFSLHRDFEKVRDIQVDIINECELDFSRYAPSAYLPKITMIWESIPFQLAKKNKKFVYGNIQDGGRAKAYEDAINWLSGFGFIYKVNRITVPDIPLKDYENRKAFKLFMVDIGLLGCMLGLKQSVLLNDGAIFDEFECALTEQYVLQQLVMIPNWKLYYYANERCACEISYLIDNGKVIVPVDIRMKANLKAKRLKTYQDKFHPKKIVQMSNDNYYTKENVVYLPLYAVEKIIEELDIC